MVAQVQSLGDLISSLLDCSSSYSSCEQVRNEVFDSLKTIGAHQPNTLLTACHQYLLQNPKLSPTCKAFVLNAIDTVVSDAKIVNELDEQLVLLIINLATQEMTMTSKETDADWAESAKTVLVTLAKSPRFVSHVMDAILQKFQPGLTTSPHRYIVLTMATVAEHNPFGLVSFLTDILSRTVPLLSHVRSDPLRSAWARAICSFCECIRECETERPVEADEGDIDGANHSPNHERENDRHMVLSRHTYTDQAEAIYEVVFQWMYSKDPKTRAEAGECVGELCLMIKPEKVVEDLKKLVSTILGLYRKAYTEQHTITKAVCRFLEATCANESCPLEPYVEDVLNALFPNACLDPDDSSVTLNPAAIKNHSEAFRCFHVAATRFADKIVYYLLHKIQSVVDMQKLGAINVLRHLLNSAGQYMEDKRSLLMMGLRKLLAAENNSSIRVKRAIVQLCVALSDHAYVDAEGGDHVTAFLVRNLVPPSDQEVQARKVEVDVAGLNQLRTQCGQALNTIASTCVCANKLLWPYLFEFICTERYFPVVGDICKCLRTLVTREIQDGKELDFETGFDNARVAGNYAVLARLFVCLCNAPLNGLLARRARESYGLMRLLSSWFHPSLPDVFEKWSERMESLMDEVCSTSLPSPSGESSPAVELRGRRIARWHEACLEMLSAGMAVVIDGEWRMSLAAVMGKQLDLYKDYPEEKAFLLRCLGTALSKIALKSFVVDHLMLMFKSTQHNIPTERQGCARGVGACASTHMDLVLIELENVSKWEHAKKSSGFFGFIKDAMPIRQYTDTEMVLLRASLMLSYGYVVQACPLDTLTQRLQQTIITFLRHYFANSKQETVVREAMLETMRLIAISVHPSRLPGDYKFDSRNELIGYIKDYVQSETPEMLSSSLRLLAAKATAALVRLEPPLSDDDIWDLGCVLTQHILPMCREKSGLKTLAYDLFDYASTSISSFTSSGSRTGTKKIDDDESATIMDATVAQYGNALEAIIEMRPTVGTVTQLLKMLLPYYGKLAEHERSRSIDATVQVLRVYLDRAEDISIGIASDFGPLSSLLARLTPRLVDSLALVRHQSLVAIHYAFRLANAYKGHGTLTDSTLFKPEEFARAYLSNEGRLDANDAKKAIRKMAEVIESRLPQCQMQTYLSALFEMMTDRQSQVSSAAAQLLTYALTCRGAILVHEADTLVTTILARLPEVHSCVQTYTDLLAALVAFAAHQQTVVCDVMLRQPLPYSVQLLDAWECVARERSLFVNTLDYLLELLTGALEQPYDIMDTGGGSSVKIVHVEPCQYAAAIAEIIKHGEPEWTLYERVPVLIAAMFHMICSVSDTQFPVVVKENKDGTKQPLIITPELRRSAERPAGLAVATLKTLLFRTQSSAVIEDMNQARGWTECLDRELFIGAITVLVRSLVEHRPEWVDSLARSVMEKSSHEREPMRLAAVIVSSALVKKSPDSNGDFNEKLLIDSIRLLENSLTDQSLRIRKLCVRGLGELSECSSEAISERFASIAVEAAMGGLDDIGDKNDLVAMESIVALNKLVSRTNDAQLHSILRQVLLKIRPCFEKESAALRAASFSLFGELAARIGGENEEFTSHLHANIVALLLHLNDEDEEVRKACSRTLNQVHPLLNVGTFSSLIQREMKDGRLPASYTAVQKDLASILALSFPDRVNQYALTCSNYFKSSNARIRANAALLTGHMLGVLTPQLRAIISKDLVFSSLVLLLRDPEDLAEQATRISVSCGRSPTRW
nr:HEAT domain containing protein [Haemonchus contortus]